MIGSLFNVFGIFSSPVVELQDWSEEYLVEDNLDLHGNCSLLSTYMGSISRNQRGTFLDVEISRSVQPGDMKILALAVSGSKTSELPIPKDYNVELEVHHDYDLSLVVCSKVHDAKDSPILRIPKRCETLIASAITLRGPDIVVDSAGMIDSAGGHRGLAFTPRIRTAEDGCLLSFFCYGDPLAVKVKDQITLTSRKTDDKGFAVGLGRTEGGTSKRIKALSEQIHKGNGNDIAVALSLY